MNIKALITTIVLGSSSVALADTSIRDHRDYRTPVAAPAPAPVTVDARAHFTATAQLEQFRRRPVRQQPLTWVSLANDQKLDGRTMIKVAPTKRQYSKLEIRADGNGRTSVDKVMIVFGNGRSQVIDLDAKLNKKSPSVSIDLQGDSRNIDRIVLVGRSNGRNASLDVLAI